MGKFDRWPDGIQGLASRLSSGRITCEELTTYCLEKMERENPVLKAWVYVDKARAIREAKALDNLSRLGIQLGPLHGVPIGVKDIFDVQGMPTSAGYAPLAGAIARKDAEVVADLRAQGALILGKTATCAFASFDPSPTLNPYWPEKTPGGSSAGSAAAVAAGHCPAAIGSQTGGSILRPAAYCGVVGFKPTHGIIPATGVFPLAPTLDHVGFFTQRLACAKTLLEATFRQDSQSSSVGSPGFQTLVFWPDVEEKICPTIPGFPELKKRFEDRGWQCREEASPQKLVPWLAAHKSLMAWEAFRFHSSLEPDWATKYPPGITALMQSVAGLNGGEVQNLYEVRRQALEELPGFLGQEEILCLPVAEGEVPSRETTGDYRYCGLASFLGIPSVAVPISLGEQSAYGGSFQLVASKGNDRHLLEAATSLA